MAKVAVFGSSKPKAGEDAYRNALRMGALLGAAGHIVMTGGYEGTMEAVSRGAAEAGGRVIGVTCDQIEAVRKTSVNPWVDNQHHFPTLRERQFFLVQESEAAVVMPGGIGTLAELAEYWSLLQAQILPRRPLILVGSEWKAVFEAFFHQMAPYIAPEHRRLLHFAGSPDEAFENLQEMLDV